MTDYTENFDDFGESILERQYDTICREMRFDDECARHHAAMQDIRADIQKATKKIKGESNDTSRTN